MQNAVVNVNGQIYGAPGTPLVSEAKVSVFDRSYLYGDSLYEVARTSNGQFIEMQAHLDRIARSAELCRMELSQPLSEYAQEMERTYREFKKLPGNQKLDVYCRLIVSRGVGKIGFGLQNLLTPTQYTIIVQPLVIPSEEQYQKGVKLRVVDRLRNDPRALDPAMKSGNYLNNLLAFLEAAADPMIPGGFDDALLCNADGHLTEGTTYNFFYVKDGILVTPPLDIGILEGITRRGIIDLARARGIDVREVRFGKDRLYSADEVFWCSTLKIAMPVIQVDHVKINGGKPGKMTAQIRKWYQEAYG